MPGDRTLWARNSRSWSWPTAAAAGLALTLAALLPASTRAQDKKPENPDLTIAVSVTDSTFLPIYLA